MKLRIQSAQVSDREQLRTLLLDNLEQLVGDNARILETKLPWEGHPILVADTRQRPVLISFDPLNAQAALLGGLQAAEQISQALAWINEVYAALDRQQHPPRLVVVSPQPPPGADSILTACPDLRLFSYRALQVNGDTGLWLESVGNTRDETDSDTVPARPRPGPAGVPDVSPAQATDSLPSLSDEENLYFRQL